MPRLSLEQQLDEAQSKVQQYSIAVARHGRRWDYHKKEGNDVLAQKALKQHDDAQRRLKQWQEKVVTVAGELAMRERTRGPVANTPEERRRRLASAGIEIDSRTAQGRRELDIVALGAKMRVTINHFNTCIKRPRERTTARRLAWNAFDHHYDLVTQGELPEPRFEPGVDTSNIPGVSVSRLAASRTDADLRAELGADLHGLLVEVVFFQKEPQELPGLSHLDYRAIIGMLLIALDRVAKFWDIEKGGEETSPPLKAVSR